MSKRDLMIIKCQVLKYGRIGWDVVCSMIFVFIFLVCHPVHCIGSLL